MFQRRRLVRSASGRARRRGQGLVEFALITPVILLLLLITIDFGRALYGWVVLQNSARIAANFAGLNPDGWSPPGTGIQVVKDRYTAEIKRDLAAANCESFGSGGGAPGN
ncbi:MAG TPA: TadE/TadG family type IV pilus assembly protein, partial [Candidatus Deferrimicrobium sp.]|nr:TadE/TadG family type IV pilus assembly protein [Candidatus Deferrimicrobium sp.]